MDLKEHVLTGSSDATLTNDGQGLAFTLKTASGPLVRLKFALADMPGFIGHLCEVVSRVHPDPLPLDLEAARHYLPAFGAATLGGNDPKTALVAFRLAGLDLGISLSAESAQDLATQLDGLARSLRTLSAQGPMQ